MNTLTSTPWHIQPMRKALRILGGPPFYRKVAETPGGRWQDAERIVMAVNVHDALMEACHLALIELDRLTGDQGFEPERFKERLRAVDRLSQALSKALNKAEA
jgi:hypothetical protein